MTASIGRVAQALGVGTRLAWLVAASGIASVATATAVATELNVLTILLGLAVLGVAVLLGLKWPILPLALFAALIPIEDLVVVEGFGTLSRFAGILFAVTYALPRLGHLKLAAMPPAAWAYLAWVLVSVGWALDPGTAVEQIVTLLQLFAIAVLVADFVVHRPATVRSILWAYSISAAATAVIGIWIFLTAGTRAAAFQNQNPEHFAATLTVALLFGLHEALNGNRRILGAAIALVTTIAVIVTGTRGAWVAIVIVVLLFMLPQISWKRRFAMAGMALALVVVAFQIPGVAELISERAGTALSTGGAGRTDIWSVAGTIYLSSPVLGVGHANFPIAYTPEMVRASDVASWVHLEQRGAHNLVILTIVELGPIGLLLLAAFVGPLALRRGWGPEALTVQAALAALLIQALLVDMFTNRKPVWLVIGFAAGLAYLARRDRATLDDRRQDAASDGPRAAPPLP
jgi:exopolysaccharide production protein ExoQ